MAPPPPNEDEVKSFFSTSLLLHGLVIIAVTLGLVFTEIAAYRVDNDTLHSGSSAQSPASQQAKNSLPAFRLALFGSTFVTYMVIKVVAVAIPITWLSIKTWIDEISLLVGGLSLVFLVLITSYKFTYCVAAPAYGIVFVAWVLLRLGTFQRFYN